MREVLPDYYAATAKSHGSFHSMA